MDNTIKYTFLLPAFKPNFFKEALKSIQSQTYTNFKVIVSDDCSPFALKAIYDEVCSQDSRFIFRRNSVNMGAKSLVSHWNLLVGMCDTEFLIMASDDDVYEPDFLKEIDTLLCKYPNVHLVRGRSRGIDGNGIIQGEEEIIDEWLDNLHFIHRIYQKDWVGGIASFVYHTDYLNSLGGFVDFPSAWFSDDVTNFMMADKGCCLTNAIVFNVRNSGVNISGQWGNPEDSRTKIKATLMNYEWMRKFMRRFDDYEDRQLLQKVNYEYQRKVYSNIQNYIYNCNIGVFLRFVFLCPNLFGLNKFRMLAHYLRGFFNL